MLLGYANLALLSVCVAEGNYGRGDERPVFLRPVRNGRSAILGKRAQSKSQDVSRTSRGRIAGFVRQYDCGNSKHLPHGTLEADNLIFAGLVGSPGFSSATKLYHFASREPANRLT